MKISIFFYPLVETWYRRQPIPTPIAEGSTAAIPELILLPERNVNGNKRTKNYIRKIRLINEFACICARCNCIEEIEDLTLDHILPKFMCSKGYYKTRQNWQLLCNICHKLKSTVELSFMSKIVRKTFESIHVNDTNLNISEIIQEYRKFIHEWNLRNRLSILFYFIKLKIYRPASFC